MRKNTSGYVEITRIIVAKNMNIPPDDIDMESIFKCVQRAIEEKVENNFEEPVLAPSNDRESRAVICEAGEKVILMMFGEEYPFGNFVNDYEDYYRTNLQNQFSKIKPIIFDKENKIDWKRDTEN